MKQGYAQLKSERAMNGGGRRSGGGERNGARIGDKNGGSRHVSGKGKEVFVNFGINRSQLVKRR